MGVSNELFLVLLKVREHVPCSKMVWESSDPKLLTPPRHTGLAFSPPVTGLQPKMFTARLLLGDVRPPSSLFLFARNQPLFAYCGTLKCGQ